MDHQILLYYKYVRIDDPAALVQAQKELCQSLRLRGRILIGHEGLNGTVEGTLENTEAYIKETSADPRFVDIHWKKSEGTGEAFPKLSVKLRPEIVSGHLGEHDVNPVETTATHLSPDDLQSWFNEGREFHIVDMRNDYEHAVGHFEGSVLPPLSNFRNLPEVLPHVEHLREKTVVTVCTGGVRCEKASGYLLKNGFTDVYQLDGGIVSYMEKYPNSRFHGKLYVFDGRIVMGVGDDKAPEYVTVGRCHLCGTPSERYVNCANLNCHLHFISCRDCSPKNETAYCSENCAKVAV
ncbi:MAG: rhodanese-related sulfurtransferase [bacterium]